MNAGLINNNRKDVYNQLQQGGSDVKVVAHVIEGHRRFTVPPQEIWSEFNRSVFCMVPAGDTPTGTFRFFSAVLSGNSHFLQPFCG